MGRKLLYNRVTGVTFPYSKTLAKNNRNVVMLDEDGQDPIEEVDATAETGSESAYDGDSIIIDKAEKSELIDFAANHYGVQLAKRKTLDELREEVRALVESDEASADQ